jgi:predicted RNase H-like nuclease (RuvC/YqgF family)
MNFNIKKVAITGGVVVGLIASYNIGLSSATTTINKEKVSYEKLVSKEDSVKKDIKYGQGNLKDIKSKTSDLESNFESRKSQFQQASELSSKVDSMKADLTKIQGDIKSKQDTSSGLDGQIKSKQAELDKLTHVVQTTGEAPIRLGAGQYVVGKDVSEGRYTVTNIGRGTNFFVYDSSGEAVVNTILGNDGIGDGDYTFFATDGEIIETHGSVKLIPVE